MASLKTTNYFPKLSITSESSETSYKMMNFILG